MLRVTKKATTAIVKSKANWNKLGAKTYVLDNVTYTMRSIHDIHTFNRFKAKVLEYDFVVVNGNRYRSDEFFSL
jgi:hypothetical protein